MAYSFEPLLFLILKTPSTLPPTLHLRPPFRGMSWRRQAKTYPGKGDSTMGSFEDECEDADSQAISTPSQPSSPFFCSPVSGFTLPSSVCGVTHRFLSEAMHGVRRDSCFAGLKQLRGSGQGLAPAISMAFQMRRPMFSKCGWTSGFSVSPVRWTGKKPPHCVAIEPGNSWLRGERFCSAKSTSDCDHVQIYDRGGKETGATDGDFNWFSRQRFHSERSLSCGLQRYVRANQALPFDLETTDRHPRQRAPQRTASCLASGQDSS